MALHSESLTYFATHSSSFISCLEHVENELLLLQCTKLEQLLLWYNYANRIDPPGPPKLVSGHSLRYILAVLKIHVARDVYCASTNYCASTKLIDAGVLQFQVIWSVYSALQSVRRFTDSWSRRAHCVRSREVLLVLVVVNIGPFREKSISGTECAVLQRSLRTVHVANIVILVS